MSARACPGGRANAGSQLQIQIYVNRHADELSKRVVEALPSLASLSPSIRWVSPLERDNFSEYCDEDFLRAVGLEHLWGSLGRFWPPNGPCWDALATVDISIPPYRGVLLVEAKSHRKEVYGKGCGATDPKHREKIKNALSTTRQWVQDQAHAMRRRCLRYPDQIDWMGRLYQYANRLAHVYFFRQVVNMPAWLVNIYFVADPQCPAGYLPMSCAQWHSALAYDKWELGLAGIAIPFVRELFLEGRECRELTG